MKKPTAKNRHCRSIFLASGGQGAFLKNRPLHPQKTFVNPLFLGNSVILLVHGFHRLAAMAAI